MFVGLMFFIAWRVLERLGRFGLWIRDAAFVVIVTQYARVNLTESLLNAGILAPWGNWMLRAAYVVLLELFLVMRSRMVCGLRNVCLLLSPILLVYAWTLLNAVSHAQVASNRRVQDAWPPQPLPADTVAAGHGVFLLVFDEWAYGRVFDETGAVKPGFPGLKRVTAKVFTAAYAPGTLTMESVPHMPFVFDRDGPRDNLHRRATTSFDEYYLNLQYADRLIYEMIDAAESLAENNRPLLVITSDHGFRYDPVLPGMPPDDLVTTRHHVPLIVIRHMLKETEPSKRRST